jgi:hypothetical protein
MNQLSNNGCYDENGSGMHAQKVQAKIGKGAY